MASRTARKSTRQSRATKKRKSSRARKTRRARSGRRRRSRARRTSRARRSSKARRTASRRRRQEDNIPSISRMDLSKLKEPAGFRDVNFNRYIRKLQKKVSPDNFITNDTIKVLDCWLKGIFNRICNEIPNRMGRRKVIKPKIINKAMKRTVPKNIREEFNNIGMMALEKFEKSFNKRCNRRRRRSPKV